MEIYRKIPEILLAAATALVPVTASAQESREFLGGSVSCIPDGPHVLGVVAQGFRPLDGDNANVLRLEHAGRNIPVSLTGPSGRDLSSASVGSVPSINGEPAVDLVVGEYLWLSVESGRHQFGTSIFVPTQTIRGITLFVSECAVPKTQDIQDVLPV